MASSLSDPPCSHPEIVQSGATTTYRTLNNMGFIFDLQDEFTNTFLQYASGPIPKGPIADLGCATGIMTKRLLQAGAKNIIANDLSADHLKVLFESLTEDEKTRTKLIPGSVLDLEETIPSNSLGGILAANLVLFFGPNQLRRLFQIFFNLLQPGGKLCIVTSNPHNAWFNDRPRVGDSEWPGLVGESSFQLNLLEPDILERETKLAGFLVEKVGYFDFGAVFEPFSSEDGVDSGSGIVAVKPG